MPSNPLKPSKVKAKRHAWHGQRPGKHPSRFSGIKSACSPEDTCATSYEFDSDRSTRRINPMQELTGSTPKAIDSHFAISALMQMSCALFDSAV